MAELLGFDGLVTNSYEAVAGADHLVEVGTLNAQALATGARLARTLMDWLSWRWVATPGDFTQGSSIMPQKRNPVVLEHLVSWPGRRADAASVLNNVGAAWWEDSNNATTDVQVRLWESNDRRRPVLRPARRLPRRAGAGRAADPGGDRRLRRHHDRGRRRAHPARRTVPGRPLGGRPAGPRSAPRTPGPRRGAGRGGRRAHRPLDDAAIADLIAAAVRPIWC